MVNVCPACGKILELKKEMRSDAVGNRGLREYWWCNNCRVEVRNPEVKNV